MITKISVPFATFRGSEGLPPSVVQLISTWSKSSSSGSVQMRVMEVSVSEGMASRSLTSAGGVWSRGAGAVILFPHPQLARKRERAIGIESEMREKRRRALVVYSGIGGECID